MQIRIIKPGLLTGVQDLGRHKFVSQAVPVSGAMDNISARLANKAVGNKDNAAVIEFTFANASFLAETDLLMAYSGGGALFMVDDQHLPPNRPILIPAGKTVILHTTPSGCRNYMAVAGGWDVPDVMDSKSTFLTAGFGGFKGRSLMKGDVLKSIPEFTETSRKILKSLKSEIVNYPTWSVNAQHFLADNKKTIRVVPGNEFSWFDDKSVADFLSAPFVVGLQSNRMGYQLEGKTTNRINTKELLSTAVTPGTIQVTGNGGLIILMADCQTTGGYPRIAQVAAVDLPVCGQFKPGDRIYFEAITRREAEKLYIEQELKLQQLSTAIQCKL